MLKIEELTTIEEFEDRAAVDGGVAGLTNGEAGSVQSRGSGPLGKERRREMPKQNQGQGQAGVVAGSVIQQHTIVFTDDQVRNAVDNAPLETVPGVAGQLLFPICTVLNFKNVRDYTNIADGAFVRVQTGGGGARVILQQIGNGVNDLSKPVDALFALGDGNSSMAWILPGMGLTPYYAQGISSKETGQDAVGKPLALAIDNQGQGVFQGGDPGNTLQVDTFYVTIAI